MSSSLASSELQVVISQVGVELNNVAVAITAAVKSVEDAEPKDKSFYKDMVRDLLAQKAKLLENQGKMLDALLNAQNLATSSAPSRLELVEKQLLELNLVVKHQAEAAEQQAEIVKQQAIALRYSELINNPKLAVFSSPSGCGSIGLSPSEKIPIRALFGGKCLFCGTTENLSIAHIIPEPSPDKLAYLPHLQEAFDSFKTPYYQTDFDVKSDRNLIVLCGSKGVAGTCHDAFDNFRVGVVHDIFHDTYSLYWFVMPQRRVPPHCPEQKLLDIPPGWQPYRRALAFHLIKCISDHFRGSRARLFDLLDLANYATASETTEQDKSGLDSQSGGSLHGFFASESEDI